jgi:hypothetical protein
LPSQDTVLDLHLVRGPLRSADADAVLRAYNHLALADVRPDNFERWLCHGPAGAAAHALLRTPTGDIVAHYCLFPFPMDLFGQRVTAAKGEYLFVMPAYRRASVSGFEAAGQMPAIVLLKQLYHYVSEELQWDPVFLNAPPGVDALHRLCGAKPVDFPLTECLFIRRPWRSAISTPNLTKKQRLVMLAAGLLQSALLRGYQLKPWRRASSLQAVSVDQSLPMEPASGKVAFCWSPDYLRWRYPEDQFVAYQWMGSGTNCLIARRGSSQHYLRVCTSRIAGSQVALRRLLLDLLAEAEKQGALGVRWAAYHHADLPGGFLRQLRRFGFLCVQRTRTILLLTRHPRLRDPAAWSMEDSLTAFEH